MPLDPDDGGSELGPYRPLHPMLEGFTMGIAFTLAVEVMVWLIYKAWQ
jgi:hypothetical protein